MLVSLRFGTREDAFFLVQQTVHPAVTVFKIAPSCVQMSMLARYLFHAGYNVYNPSLEGQCFADTDKYWPRVRLVRKSNQSTKNRLGHRNCVDLERVVRSGTADFTKRARFLSAKAPDNVV